MKIKLIDFGLSNWVKDRGDTYLPNRAKYNDAGSDVRALSHFTIPPYSVYKIPLGFGVQIPDGYMGLLLPRSGLNSKGITVLFSPIDSGYRGELAINVYNTTNEPYEINEGDKIGQLVIIPCVISDFVWELGEERGTNGFGSTDEKVNNEREFNSIESMIGLSLKSVFTFNPQTNRYDYDGDLDNEALRNFVSEDKDGFTINFGKITGYFNCSNLGLKSLKGAPTEVSKWFECTNNRFTSLEGAPQTVRSFYCYYNLLTSLKGAPQTVNGDFKCSYNFLTSLEGAPTKIGGTFNCSNNKLTSLEGAPQEVGGSFSCSYNQLPSLEGAPQEVEGWFYCSDNQLTSLKGAPQKIYGGFYCHNNRLTSLEGAPTEVDGCFDCSWNKLISLKGAPQIIGEWFDCHSNLDLHSLYGIGEVKGKIYKDF